MAVSTGDVGVVQGTQRGPAPKLGLGTKLAYGFGSVAFGVKDNGFRTFLLLFYNQVVGLPATTVSWAILIAMVFDAFLDPLIGHVSDNWRSKWGRRHPFMYAAAAPAALSYLLLWNPPYQWPQAGLIAWLVAVAVLSRTFITVFEIPSSSMAAELSDNYDERTTILSFRYFFAWWGGLALTIAAYTIFLQPSRGFPVGQLNRDGYSHYGLTAALIMFVTIILSALGTHRRIPWLREPPPPRKLSLRESTREVIETLSNRPFLIMASVALFAAAAEGAGFTISLYFFTYFWQLSGAQSGMLVAAGFIGSAAAAFAAPAISRTSGKKGAAMLLLAITVLLSAAPLSLRLLGWFPANGSPLLIPILFANDVIRGTLGITCAILVTAMIADVVEDSQLQTGRRSEGVFFAAVSFIAKSVSGVGTLIVGLILSGIHFPAKADPAHMDPAIVRNLALAYLPVLFVLYAITLTLLSFYRITRESHQATLERLAAIEAAAEASTPTPP